MCKYLKSYLLIKRSGFFDAKYYLQNNPDVRKADINPLMHYIKHGWKERRNPSVLFDANFYLDYYKDIRDSHINPLIHYLYFGKKEGRKITAIGLYSSNRNQPTKTEQLNVSNLNLPNNIHDERDVLITLKKSGNYLYRSLHYIRDYGFMEFWKKARNELSTILASSKRRSITSNNNKNESSFSKGYSQLLSTALNKHSDEYVENNNHKNEYPSSRIKLIAFYLPQFYPISENDEWWGRGFTEWVNVSKAVPQFIGHYQPHLPGELGFYDLRVPEIQERQVELAKNYGIYGFCFYYYWFNGKRLLEQPLDQFVSNDHLDFPFCVCWANENWTRRWDGTENAVLISQEHSYKIDRNIIHDLLKLFQKPRYIRIENRPLLIVYRADILKDGKKTLDYWRKVCINNGLENPYIVVAQSFGYYDPTILGFDAAVSFPPHDIRLREINDRLSILNDEYCGRIWSYPEYVLTSIKNLKPTPYTQFHSVFPCWDNEPRRPGRGMTFAFGSPGYYKKWLENVSRYTLRNNKPKEGYVFINAWNEWGEGAHLEPDRKYGYAYLEATHQVLLNISKSHGWRKQKRGKSVQKRSRSSQSS